MAEDEITANVNRMNVLAAAMLQGVHDAGLTLTVPHSYRFRSTFYATTHGPQVTAIELVEIEVDGSGEKKHAPFPHTKDHQGPPEETEFDHWACWCDDADRCVEVFRQ